MWVYFVLCMSKQSPVLGRNSAFVMYVVVASTPVNVTERSALAQARQAGRRDLGTPKKHAPFLRALFLGEVPHDVIPALVDFAQDVEQKQVHVVVKRLVVQEKLGEVTKVLRLGKRKGSVAESRVLVF